jgi:large subunit ribosomal protein L10
MLEFAVADTEFDGLKPFLAGPTAVAFSFGDATAAASLISKQFKAMPKLELKAGAIDGTVYDANGMKVLADIPPREVLLSRLLGSFKSPISGFARVVKAIAEKKEESA